MSRHTVKVLDAQFINHDVKRFVLEKPEGFYFVPGQATTITVNHPDWINEERPFTFTSLNEWPYLEFTIKIYNERKGVTAELGKINAGNELTIDDVFGAISYKGPGVFIAGGAGVTPFIAILRALQRTDQIQGNKLIFSNKMREDLFLEEEFTRMLGNDFIKVFTREGTVGFLEKRIDRKFLIETIKDFSQHFYVCGPDQFVHDIHAHLESLGASSDTIIFEQ